MAHYSKREMERRYPYWRWFITTERAELRTRSNRQYRRRAEQQLRAAPDYDALALPMPPKTSGWLTW
jgi:hypothetical protein